MSTKSFGSYLAGLRREKKLTQKEVADYLYVSDKTVSRWETDRSLPELSLIPALADLLEVSADELLRNGLTQTDEETQEDDVTNAMAENVARVACRKFNRNGLIALLAFLIIPILTVWIFISSSDINMSYDPTSYEKQLSRFVAVILPRIIVIAAVALSLGAFIYLIALYLIQNRHIRECGAPESVRKMYQDRLFARFVLYFGIIGFLILLILGWLLPAIAVIAVVLVCSLILRSKRA